MSGETHNADEARTDTPPEAQCLRYDVHPGHQWTSLTHRWLCPGRAILLSQRLAGYRDPLIDPPPPPAIDAMHLRGQRAWSRRTFGPGPRTLGLLDHIRKELTEIEAAPDDVEEWVDVIILAFDGAWRAGWEPQQIIDAIKAKQAKNESREWPDWRTMSDDQAIQHVRMTTTEGRDQ